MFHSAWDDAELSSPERNFLVPKLDDHFASPNQKQLVFKFVMVPGEFAANFHELDFLTV